MTAFAVHKPAPFCQSRQEEDVDKMERYRRYTSLRSE